MVIHETKSDSRWWSEVDAMEWVSQGRYTVAGEHSKFPKWQPARGGRVPYPPARVGDGSWDNVHYHKCVRARLLHFWCREAVVGA
jgi:hypothetical protein